MRRQAAAPTPAASPTPAAATWETWAALAAATWEDRAPRGKQHAEAPRRRPPSGQAMRSAPEACTGAAQEAQAPVPAVAASTFPRQTAGRSCSRAATSCSAPSA
ncbi:hypothetical protein B5F44_03640 [Gordonibacter urolithinfaciens]|nr:hypothetical protein B5F44_03640 [Gordonibacter urolithinfaciens]